jgi:RecF/RecN/SMC N terminal domain
MPVAACPVHHLTVAPFGARLQSCLGGTKGPVCLTMWSPAQGASWQWKRSVVWVLIGAASRLTRSNALQGIIFSVRPPKKSWKNIANLSGGEKTLSSLSLVFALHHFRPTPLYVMDEIDAALGEDRASNTYCARLCSAGRINMYCCLSAYHPADAHVLMPWMRVSYADFKNVSIVAHYIKERTRDAQFIIISLRNNMFELADRLVRSAGPISVHVAPIFRGFQQCSSTEPHTC